MSYYKIITENQLDIWVLGNAQLAQGIIVELVSRLVAASSQKPKERRFPLPDSIGQPGPDGYLNTDFSFEPFVPEGKSYWEIGTGTNSRDKATSDYNELTAAIPENIRQESTFIFITPLSARRGWGFTWKGKSQVKWQDDRRRRKEWRDVRVIDATRLIDWISYFPAVEQWLAVAMGMPVGQIQTPEQIWAELKTIGEPPPLPPQLFLVNRDAACEKLKEVFLGNIPQLKLETRSPEQVVDFVAAYIASLSGDEQLDNLGRCLVISGIDGWNEIVTLREKHVLIANFDLDNTDPLNTKLLEKARRAGHAVIFGGMPGSLHPNQVAIPNPKTYQIKEALEKAGYKEERARTLAQRSGENLSSLLRFLQHRLVTPARTLGGEAADLAIAGLLGSWEENSEADITISERLSGKQYSEWIGRIREISLQPGTPLIYRNGTWKFISRYESWHALGSRIFNEHLDRLKEVAVTVLCEKNPLFELPHDDRLTASIRGKVLTYSQSLRTGLAETLALLGSYSQALTSCSFGKAETTAVLSVREILSNADWMVWASLNTLLPLLAEASPREFLDVVESALNQSPCPFDEMFSQERSGITSSNFMVGLLWALETLAWDAELLTRVVMVLGELAARDPGGNSSNRPANSMKNILLPWFPQTCASVEQRIIAFKTLIRELPQVAWNLILDLLPQQHQFASYSRKPEWRVIVPDDWSEGATPQEYWEQVSTYTDLAINISKSSFSKLARLIGRLDDFTPSTRDQLLEYLGSASVVAKPQEERLQLWNELMDFITRHKRFIGADWALQSEEINKIVTITDRLTPESPYFRYQRLFSDREHYLYDEKGSYQDQHRKLENERKKAISEIYEELGISGIMDFAREVEYPLRVGLSFGSTEANDAAGSIIPNSLGSELPHLAQLSCGFIMGKFRSRGWQWVDEYDMSNWSQTQKGQFLACLPFTSESWHRITELLGADETTYWSIVNPNPYEAESGLEYAIDRLIENGRANVAIKCFDKLLYDKKKLDSKQAIRALQSFLTSTEAGHMDGHTIVDIIKAIQDDPETDENELFKIEWVYLPFLDRYDNAFPKVLESRLANDPDFFCEVIRAVFRSRKEGHTNDEPTEIKKNIAQNSYRLLSNWHILPGGKDDGTIDDKALNEWLHKVKSSAIESGHLEVAMTMFGHVLAYAPPDPDGLWIHHSAANVLNEKEAGRIREGFTTELFNSRGVFSWSAGKEERNLATKYRDRAEKVEAVGYYRLAGSLRKFANSYERMADQEASRGQFDD